MDSSSNELTEGVRLRETERGEGDGVREEPAALASGSGAYKLPSAAINICCEV